MRVWEKLKSRSGASMMFAILVFMLCVLAGTAALTAAAANMGRYTHLESEQQEYLSMSSAAKLLKEELTGATFTAKLRQVKITLIRPGSPEQDPPVLKKAEWVDGNEPKYDGKFDSVLQDFYTTIFIERVKPSVGEGNLPAGYTEYPGSGPVEKTYTLELDGDDSLGKLEVKLTAKEDFTIRVEIEPESSSWKGYKTILTLQPSTDGVTHTSKVDTEYRRNAKGEIISWTDTTTTDYEMTVKWLPENTVISEGAATT